MAVDGLDDNAICIRFIFIRRRLLMESIFAAMRSISLCSLDLTVFLWATVTLLFPETRR